MKIIDKLKLIDLSPLRHKESIIKEVIDLLGQNFTVAEVDVSRPWGGFIKLSDKDAEKFINEMFNTSLSEASLGVAKAKISPKILVVEPGKRLSWQYHEKRAELWRFLSPGAYHSSNNDKQGSIIIAKIDTKVQFEVLQRHRLVALESGFCLVGEIWQHSDPNELSNEDDILRVQDDYSRQ